MEARVTNSTRRFFQSFILFEDFCKFVLQCFSTKTTGNYISLRVNQKVIWNARDGIYACCYRLPILQVRKMMPGHLPFINCFYPSFFVFVEREAYDIKPFFVILFIGGNYVWHFRSARATPRCPEIDQNPFAVSYKFAQFVGYTVRITLHEILEFLSNNGLLTLCVLSPLGISF